MADSVEPGPSLNWPWVTIIALAVALARYTWLADTPAKKSAPVPVEPPASIEVPYPSPLVLGPCKVGTLTTRSQVFEYRGGLFVVNEHCDVKGVMRVTVERRR